MKKQATIMTMPVTIEVVDVAVCEADIEAVFDYLRDVDERMSVFKPTSEISRINAGLLSIKNASAEMRYVLQLCEKTSFDTNGYFDMHLHGRIDPTGLVKGYAIHRAADLLRAKHFQNFFVDIAGDIEVSGKNANGKSWRIGIQNPFQPSEIIKIIELENGGVATSGTYQRGKHIYDPIHHRAADAIASMTVVGPNVYEADRFATAAFAMGEDGIRFVDGLPHCEGYMVTHDRRATLTRGFHHYVARD